MRPGPRDSESLEGLAGRAGPPVPRPSRRAAGTSVPGRERVTPGSRDSSRSMNPEAVSRVTDSDLSRVIVLKVMFIVGGRPGSSLFRDDLDRPSERSAPLTGRLPSPASELTGGLAPAVRDRRDRGRTSGLTRQFNTSFS